MNELRFPDDVDVLAVGPLAEDCRLADRDGALQFAVLEAHLELVRVQAKRALAKLDVAVVHAKSGGEVDVDRVGVDDGRLVAIGLQGMRAPHRQQQSCEKERDNMFHGQNSIKRSAGPSA